MKDLTINDIELPKQVEAALVSWWNGRREIRECDSHEATRRNMWAIEAVRVALLAITKEPVVPTVENDEAEDLFDSWNNDHRETNAIDLRRVIGEWQRRMFLRKPDPVPDEVKALLVRASDLHINQSEDNEREVNARITKAFELGKRLGAETRAK